jgi:hypothetical protein
LRGLLSTTDPGDRRRYPFRFTEAYRVAARPFGITPERAWVEIGDVQLCARYGPWRVRTALENVESVAITGPYRFFKTAGPARLAITDRGLTFASNGAQGVLLTFRRPIRGLDPLGLIQHPELTVTVEDITGLAEALRSAAETAVSSRPAASPSEPRTQRR